ncbi:MAG: TolC family protein, partial [Deltaproteobacteria bacterium]|nr:TolC family protein [Deltaproteobacteria bacterium]
MLNATIVLCTFLAASGAGAAGPGAGAAEPAARKLTLDAVLEHARGQPSVEAARASAREAHARAREVSRSWLPTLEVTVVGGPSQNINCHPSPAQCITTEPSETRLGFDGLFGRIDGKLFMPLFTFGKISNGIDAAEAGAVAGDALAEGAEHGAVLDAAKAFFAVKLGRELLLMLAEGLDYVDDELVREEEQLEKGSGEVTESDHRRVLTLRAEILVRT